VWTGRHVLVWGGVTGRTGTLLPPHGEAFNPATNTWMRIPPSPLHGRENPISVWTGHQMIVWGGDFGSTAYINGAAFTPAGGNWPIRPHQGAGAADGTGSLTAQARRRAAVQAVRSAEVKRAHVIGQKITADAPGREQPVQQVRGGDREAEQRVERHPPVRRKIAVHGPELGDAAGDLARHGQDQDRRDRGNGCLVRVEMARPIAPSAAMPAAT